MEEVREGAGDDAELALMSGDRLEISLPKKKKNSSVSSCFSLICLLEQKQNREQGELHSASWVSRIHEFKCLKCLSAYPLSSTYYM